MGNSVLRITKLGVAFNKGEAELRDIVQQRWQCYESYTERNAYGGKMTRSEDLRPFGLSSLLMPRGKQANGS